MQSEGEGTLVFSIQALPSNREGLSTSKRLQLYSDVGNTIAQAAVASIKNLIPDAINSVLDWTERFLHKEPGSYGRVDRLESVESEVVESISNDFRMVGAVLTAYIPLRFTPGSISVTKSGDSRVGRWMSPEELANMRRTGQVQEGSGGMTFAATSGPGSFRKQAKPGSNYVEFDVSNNSLLQGGKTDWFKTLGPNAPKSQLFKLNKQGGEINPPFRNLSEVIETK